MAGNTIKNINSNTISLPQEVIDSDWKDDVDADYAIYGGTEEGESEYVNKQKLTDAAISKIKARKIKLLSISPQALSSLRREALATA